MKKVAAAAVKENILIAPDIYRMELELGENISAQPGQFVNVYLDDAAHLLPRPISICRAEDRSLTLVYRAVGTGTCAMSKMTAGDTIRVSDPLGNGFTLPESGTVLLVGGGVGVPPMLGTAIAAKAKGLNVIVAHGYRSELFLKDEFEQVGSLLVATDDGSSGFCGTVVDMLRQSNIPKDTTVLSCGPKPMLKALVEYCKEAGFDVQVSLEERMGCGFGACVGCVCKLNVNGETVQKRVCKDGPVFNGKEVIF